MNANRNAILNGGATIAPFSDGIYVMNELHALKVPPRPRPAPAPPGPGLSTYIGWWGMVESSAW